VNTFKDKNDNEWNLSMTTGDLTAVRQATGVKLGEALRSESALVEALFTEPETFVRVLWVICEKQAAAKNVTPEQFGYGFDGPAIERATQALLESIADFFPRSAMAQAIKRRLPEMLTSLDKRAVQEMDKAMDTISKGNVGALPASSGLTQIH